MESNNHHSSGHSILTLPVDAVSVNRLIVPRLFCTVILPKEEVEFGLNTALFPEDRLIAEIEIPDGRVWAVPSFTHVPVPGGLLY
jgi:hypothetical protein